MSSKYDPEITPEMKSRYITRRADDVVKLEAAAATEDYVTLRAVAHQIKGNAATFSFRDLEQHALALEEAAEAQVLAECISQIARIKDWVQAQACLSR